MPTVVKFFGLLLGTVAALLLCKFTDFLPFEPRQIASIAIFSTFIYGTLLFGEFRLAFAFGGIGLLMAFNLLTVERFILSASLNVIIFLVGMFLVIGFLEENRFFESVVGRIVKFIGPRPKVLLTAVMLMGTVAAALVDEVTSILFMSGTMLHLTSKYRLNPVPFIIMLVFATNIGSAASSIGNPIGVMIALKAGFSFLEFLRWSAPIAIVVNLVTYGICRWWFYKEIREFELAVEAEHARMVRKTQPALATVGGGDAGGRADAAEDAEGGEGGTGQDIAFLEPEQERAKPVAWLVFLCTIALLVTHGLTEHWLGQLFHAPGGHLPEGTMLIGTALIMGATVLFIQGNRARELVERRVDWWTLTFFMMLFASVGTLKETGVTRLIADRLIAATGEDNHTMVIMIVGWSTGWLSAFLDNVLAVATFLPVVEDIRSHTAPAGYPEAIYWLMLFGGTFMGNMTVIGSTANIIACGVLEKRGHGTVSFGYWFKVGLPVSIASMLVATLMLGLQTDWFTSPMLPAPVMHNIKEMTNH